MERKKIEREQKRKKKGWLKEKKDWKRKNIDKNGNWDEKKNWKKDSPAFLSDDSILVLTVQKATIKSWLIK